MNNVLSMDDASFGKEEVKETIAMGQCVTKRFLILGGLRMRGGINQVLRALWMG